MAVGRPLGIRLQVSRMPTICGCEGLPFATPRRASYGEVIRTYALPPCSTKVGNGAFGSWIEVHAVAALVYKVFL
jgi:hypothetical protein